MAKKRASLLAILAVAAALLLAGCAGGNNTAETTSSTSTAQSTSGQASSGTTATEQTTESSTGAMSDDELLAYADGCSKELLSSRELKVIAGEASVVLNAYDAGAVATESELRAYFAEHGIDAALVDRYLLISQDSGTRGFYDQYIQDKLTALAEAADGGTETAYVVNGDVVTITRGLPSTVFDAEAALALVKEKLAAGSYGDITLEVSTKEAAKPELEALAASLKVAPEDAKLSQDAAGNTIIIPEVYGKELDVDAIYTALDDTSWDTKDFTLTSITPAVTSEQLNADTNFYGDLLGSAVTYYNTGEAARSNNVKLAADFINGKILMPGEEFSFNQTVGVRTYDRGFQDAIVFQNGGMENGVGGGICQVSTTVYIAALYAEMEQVSRYAHAYTVSYSKLGMDATVYWGYLDYVFRNNTDYPIKVVTSCSNGTLSVKIYGTETRPSNRKITFKSETTKTIEAPVTYETDPSLEPGTSVVKSSGKPGYVVDLYKVVTVDGAVTETVKVNHSNYSPYKRVIRQGPEAGTTASSETTTAVTTAVPPSTTTSATTTSAAASASTEPPATTATAVPTLPSETSAAPTEPPLTTAETSEPSTTTDDTAAPAEPTEAATTPDSTTTT